jgi:hypothetical protein
MNKTNFGIYTLVLLIVLVGMAYFGGLPSPDEMPVFMFGTVVLVGFSLAILGLAWYFLFRPLPENYAISPSPLSPFVRQGLGLILIISMSLVAVGGAWDEAWHTLYGVPFGEDFFWRPHILIYTGFITLILFSAIILFALLRNGKGTISQRLRSDSLFAYIIFIGLFMVYALPADPIWHEIYGEDLTAFSIPHILLGFIFLLPLIIGVGIFVSSSPKRIWQSIFRFRGIDIPPLFAFIGMQLVLCMLLLSNWELLNLQPNISPTDISRSFPDWLLPVFLVFIGAFIGIMANHSLRYYGVASVIGLISLGFRLLLLRLLDHELQNAPSWIIVLLVYLVIDIFYAIFLRNGTAPKWWQSGIVAGLGMSIFGLPLINMLYPLPEVSLSNLPVMLIASLGGGLLAAWFAQAIGDNLAETPRYLAEESSRMKLVGMTGLVVIATLIFFFWFIMTATPPVL